jgi:Domain of unknown function (DUF4124)
MRRTLIYVAALMLAFPAWGQIYRCNVGGRVVYQDSPCRGGANVDLSNATPPDQLDQVRAERQALTEKLRAEQLRRRDDAEYQAMMRRQQQRAEAERSAVDLQQHKEARCRQRARDVEWVRRTAARYPGSPWWQNRAKDFREDYELDCR